jgi:hemerythrin superfamily protein
MIRQDHKKVEGLFTKFEQTKGAQAKKRIAENAMTEFEIHAQLEEELFYPAVEKEVEDAADLVPEAREEHQRAKELISELKGKEEVDEEFESQFGELVETVQHHVQEEENEILPKVEESDLDLKALGDQMAQRRQELQGGSTASRKRASSASGRKSAGRKTTARKATARKATSKKAASSKTAARKSQGRKTTGRKSSGRSRRRA